ncbi:MAG: sulfatase-like hydrolase/transferase [Planctomycetaceae bacterium]|nr:sulfatase-like hydrolase/transferase [Planctomycetaceae bacterium]
MQVLLLPGLCLMSVCSSLAAAAPARPNILFIFTDDHAAHAMSCYGSKINTTPNLDRIAAGGMRFDRCYCTNSLCGPSRAVILTGKHSHLNGFMKNGDRFDGGQQTFPKLLQQAGYQTAVIGKWHLGTSPTGFDNWHVLIGQGPYYNPTMIDNGERVKHTGYTTDIITDLALETLKNRDPEKPFMLMFQHKAPHREWQPSPKHLTMYDDVTIPEPDDLFDTYEGRGTPARTQEMTVARHLRLNEDLKLAPPRNLTPDQLKAWNAAYEPKNRAFREAKLTGKDLVRWQYQRYIKDYLRCVASVDDNVGRVLDFLDESGLAENTIVIYSSDQGFFLGDHGWYDKRFMYEEAYRMPLLVRWPGVVQPGSVENRLVSNLDFAETFLEAASVRIPADMQGHSLVPLLKGEAPDDWQEALYYHYYEFPAVHMVRRHNGVQTDRYKLMHFYNIDEWELYDRVQDPDELRSVYGDEKYADIVRELKQKLKDLQEQYHVPDDSGSVPKEVPPRRPRQPKPRQQKPQPKS